MVSMTQIDAVAAALSKGETGPFEERVGFIQRLHGKWVFLSVDRFSSVFFLEGGGGHG